MAKVDENRTGTPNLDPLTGAPGAHPVGVGVGAVAGGVATGAAVGTVAGPIGTGIGGAIGAVVGGLVGKGVAESVDPTLEQGYWRENYASRDYVDPGRKFEDYAPAYDYGVRRYDATRSFEDVEPDLAGDWDSVRGNSDLEWNDARPAARDAWERVGTRATAGAAWAASSVVTSDRVEGTAVYDTSGDKLGSIDHLVIDKRSGQVRYAVLEFGGFLGMGTDRYPLPWSVLNYSTDRDGYIVPLDKDSLRGAPRYSMESRPSYDDAYGRSIYDYYGARW
jgi:hypothetical protein